MRPGEEGAALLTVTVQSGLRRAVTPGVLECTQSEGLHRAASGSLLGGPREGGGDSSGSRMQLRRRSPEVHSVLGAARPVITDFQTRPREGDVLAGGTQLTDVGARMHLLPGSGAPGPGFRP